MILDLCGKHGVFLDRGELTAVVAFFESGGLARIKKRERERLAEEVAVLESKKRGAVSGVFLGGPDRDGTALESLLAWLGSVLGRSVR